MSAFVVSDDTITGILTAIYLGRCQGERPSYFWDGKLHYITDARELGQKLLDENYRSVAALYGERADEKWSKRTYRILRDIRVTPIEIVKLCDCYSYQACEASDWLETEAYAIVNALRDQAITNLPGYKEARWDL